MSGEQYANLNFVLTYKCDLYCRHCLSDCGPGRTEVISMQAARECLDAAVTEMAVGSVGCTGGEPFLVYEMVRELLSYSYQKYGIQGGVVTNCGWAESADLAERKLRELYRCGLRSMVVSCDSFHLRFVSPESIKRVVHAALDLGILITVNTVVTRSGSVCKNDVPALLDIPAESLEKRVLIKELGPLRVGRALDRVREDELIATDQEQYFNGSCPFVIWTPTVTPNGSVYACCCFGNAERNPSDLIGYCGNTRQTDFKSILRLMQNNLFFNLAARHGPYSLFKMIRQRRPEIPVRGRYLCNCDICVELYHNAPVRQELAELLTELAMGVEPDGGCAGN